MGTKIYITGGGTGGHVYPGLSVAEALQAMDASLEIHYVGKDTGIEVRLVKPTGLPFHGIKASGLRGMGWSARLKFLLNFLVGFAQSFSLMLFKRPALVLGCGGYVSAPVLAAAGVLGITCSLQEQNAMPGSTNRLTGRWSKRVYLGFGGAADFFPPGRSVLTGNPVRATFAAAVTQAMGQVQDNDNPTITRVLIFGGSLGASSLNKAVMEAAALWSENRNVTFVIQTGPAMEKEVASCFAKADHVQVLSYIDDMPAALLRADLVVCRAGASTLAELQVVGKPSILIPFPNATDNHQLSNARDMETAGASVVLEDHLCHGESLVALVATQLADGPRLKEMGLAAAALARPHAARDIAADILYYCKHEAGVKAATLTEPSQGNSLEEPKSVS